MTFAAGQKLGPYEILASVGAGGMGEVYRARDTRLGRDVAIKVSQERFNERFEREARAIAALNHPNICGLYDVGPDYLVMEYVEGESPRGPMPVDDALAIAMQIANALQDAHERGIVHRDLKPANIKVTPNGTVKVLDFGLAKMGGTPTASSDNSPTITAGGTQAGVILGTAAYMSPEQARGKPVDSRADIWAFGVVLYELITGQRLFKGDDLTETLASVVKENPDLSAVPLRVRRLLDACLQKDPKKRLQSIGDVRLLLQDESSSVSAPSGGRFGTAAMAAVAAVAAVAILVAAGLAYVHLRETPPVERALQLSVPLPDGSSVGFLQLSPDGSRLVLLLTQNGQAFGQLYLRSLESGGLQPLAGTAVARSPFWSFDSRFIGFFADGKLKIVPAAGGPAQVFCAETGLGFGGTWSRDGVILVSSDDGKLRRVDATGGDCRVVGKPDADVFATYPTFMPDGDHFFYLGGRRSDVASSGVYLATLAEPIGKRVLADQSSVVYTPAAAAGGRAHLLFLRQGSLMAQPFDDATLQAVGDPFVVTDRASATLNSGQLAASASGDGTLVYLVGRSRDKQLTWFDRTGKALGTIGPTMDQNGVGLSRDGNFASISRIAAGEPPALWIYDLMRGSESRLTPAGAPALGALWLPDSTRIWFAMVPRDAQGLYQKDVKSGQQELVEKLGPNALPPGVPSDFSADGRLLIYTSTDPKTRADVSYAPIESGKPDWKAGVRLVSTDAVDSQGQLSPDGKWLAYYSAETGTPQVYVRPFPNGAGVWKVSVERGGEPRWRADGKELYFLAAQAGQVPLMAASVAPDGRGGLRIGVPQRLFGVPLGMIVAQSNVFSYSVHPDGRFLINTLMDTGEAIVNVITNWNAAAIKTTPSRAGN